MDYAHYGAAAPMTSLSYQKSASLPVGCLVAIRHLFFSFLETQSDWFLCFQQQCDVQVRWHRLQRVVCS